MGRLRIFALAMVLGFTGSPGLAQAYTTVIHILDTTGTEGVAGVVVLVISVQSGQKHAFVTNSDGRVSIPRLSGSICSVTALDPAGLFFSETTEFACKTSSVTLTLRVRPIIDKVDVSNSAKLKITVNGPNGKPLANQSVLIRTAAISVERGGMFVKTTDRDGEINTRLSPGHYVIATLIEENPYEAELVLKSGKQKCPSTDRSCFSLGTGSRKESPIVLRLLPAPVAH